MSYQLVHSHCECCCDSKLAHDLAVADGFADNVGGPIHIAHARELRAFARMTPEELVASGAEDGFCEPYAISV